MEGQVPLEESRERSHSRRRMDSASSCPYKQENTATPKVSTPSSSKGVYYHDYLQLEKILTAQSLESERQAVKVHDEHLFIIIHQTYELWFKQILYELDHVKELFSPDYVPERSIGPIVATLTRISEIFRVINTQLTILETMTPLSFRDFRNYLYPASGFQSLQFRKLEISLGLLPEQRVRYGKRSYCSYLSEKHADECKLKEGEASIIVLLEKWLERIPFLEIQGIFSFWKEFKDATDSLCEQERQLIKLDGVLTEEEKAAALQEIDEKNMQYRCMYDENEYQKLLRKGSIRLSFKAMQAALLIMLYQDEPILQTPNALLMRLCDIDQHMTQWRYRHASMVQRMIGNSMGTGGSSGYNYLRATVSQHRIFKDLFVLPTFLIPRNDLPALPQPVVAQMSFQVESPELKFRTPPSSPK